MQELSLVSGGCARVLVRLPTVIHIGNTELRLSFHHAVQFVELGDASPVRRLNTANASADWAKYSLSETKVHLAASSAW